MKKENGRLIGLVTFLFIFIVRNEEVLLRVKEQRNILHEIRKRKANWIGHIFVYFYCEK